MQNRRYYTLSIIQIFQFSPPLWFKIVLMVNINHSQFVLQCICNVKLDQKKSWISAKKKNVKKNLIGIPIIWLLKSEHDSYRIEIKTMQKSNNNCCVQKRQPWLLKMKFQIHCRRIHCLHSQYSHFPGHLPRNMDTNYRPNISLRSRDRHSQRKVRGQTQIPVIITNSNRPAANLFLTNDSR